MEAVTPPYRWGARVSAYTGLPTVVGWDWHEIVRKCGLAPCPAVHERLRDVERGYSTSDPREALAVLRKYDVSYVYVGELERLYYPAEGLATLRRDGAAGNADDGLRGRRGHDLSSRRVTAAESLSVYVVASRG